MIPLEGLAERVRRLKALTEGLARELLLWKDRDDPLLYLERRSYLGAMEEALAKLEQSRLVLVGALQRLAQDQPQRKKPQGD